MSTPTTVKDLTPEELDYAQWAEANGQPCGLTLSLDGDKPAKPKRPLPTREQQQERKRKAYRREHYGV